MGSLVRAASACAVVCLLSASSASACTSAIRSSTIGMLGWNTLDHMTGAPDLMEGGLDRNLRNSVGPMVGSASSSTDRPRPPDRQRQWTMISPETGFESAGTGRPSLLSVSDTMFGATARLDLGAGVSGTGSGSATSGSGATIGGLATELGGGTDPFLATVARTRDLSSGLNNEAVAPVPLPSGLWLVLSALGLGWLLTRRRPA